MSRPWGTLRALVGPIGGPIYRRVIASRNRRFDAGDGVDRLPIPVVSIGNLSTGGTGKTPMVAWVVARLAERGVRAVIAMRGYARDAHGRSDEADEYARLLPGVPVVADPKRHDAVTRLLNERGIAEVDIAVLDDGFQHRQLHRDIDIVLVDATADPFADRLLPGGNLREPVESLRRAQAIVVTHAEAVGTEIAAELASRLSAAAPQAVLAICRHHWAGLVVLEAGVEREQPITWLSPHQVMPVCGIGNPGAFLDEAQRHAHLVEPVVRPDHDRFDESTVRWIIDQAQERHAEALLVTEKDWSKLSRVEASCWPCPIARVRMQLRFDSGEAALLGLLDSVRKPRPA